MSRSSSLVLTIKTAGGEIRSMDCVAKQPSWVSLIRGQLNNSAVRVATSFNYAAGMLVAMPTAIRCPVDEACWNAEGSTTGFFSGAVVSSVLELTVRVGDPRALLRRSASSRHSVVTHSRRRCRRRCWPKLPLPSTRHPQRDTGSSGRGPRRSAVRRAGGNCPSRRRRFCTLAMFGRSIEPLVGTSCKGCGVGRV